MSDIYIGSIFSFSKQQVKKNSVLESSTNLTVADVGVLPSAAVSRFGVITIKLPAAREPHIAGHAVHGQLRGAEGKGWGAGPKALGPVCFKRAKLAPTPGPQDSIVPIDGERTDVARVFDLEQDLAAGGRELEHAAGRGHPERVRIGI